MKVVSLNLGAPREVELSGERLHTGIVKTPVEGAVRLSVAGFEGDGQADTRAHGGPYKAAYAYPSEHHAHWRETLGIDGGPGHYGENLTTAGLLESELCVGDVLRVGEALVQVSQPRQPCRKLALRVGRPDFVQVFLESLRVGFYLRVLEPGAVRAGDAVVIERRDPAAMSIEALTRLTFFDRGAVEPLRRALRAEGLFPEWRERLAARLAKLSGSTPPERTTDSKAAEEER